MKKQQIIYCTLKSPIGEIIVTADKQGITSIYSPTHETLKAQLENAKRYDAKLRDATDQLRAYFAARCKSFHSRLTHKVHNSLNKYGSTFKLFPTEQRYHMVSWQSD